MLVNRIGLNMWLFMMMTCGCSEKKPHMDHGYVSESYSSTIHSDSLIDSYLADKLPGYSLVNDADMDPLWESLCPENKTPTRISTDLNDDQIPDYGLLVRKDSILCVLLMVSDPFSMVYSHTLLDGFPAIRPEGIQFGLSIVPPQQIDLVINHQERSFLLLSNSVQITFFETLARIYYFDKGSVQTIWVK